MSHERAPEMRKVRIANLASNFGYREVGMYEEPHSFVHAPRRDIGMRRHAGRPAETPQEVERAQRRDFRKMLEGQRAAKFCADGLLHPLEPTPVERASAQKAHRQSAVVA